VAAPAAVPVTRGVRGGEPSSGSIGIEADADADAAADDGICPVGTTFAPNDSELRPPQSGTDTAIAVTGTACVSASAGAGAGASHAAAVGWRGPDVSADANASAGIGDAVPLAACGPCV
jgi:hypothetical protein